MFTNVHGRQGMRPQTCIELSRKVGSRKVTKVALEAGSEGPLTREGQATREAEILKAAIFGGDLLPQAVELTKLSLRLTAARKGEPSALLFEATGRSGCPRSVS
jgi:hypothetical protein